MNEIYQLTLTLYLLFGLGAAMQLTNGKRWQWGGTGCAVLFAVWTVAWLPAFIVKGGILANAWLFERK